MCNAFGVRLLDICKSNCIRVVNGRLCDDCSKGDFTFISHNGSSVIDYLLTKECNFSNISQFKILENNVFSDHSPVMFSLLHGVVLPKHDTPVEVRVKWDSKRRDEFRSALIAQLPTLYHVTDNIDTSSIGSINSAVDKFTYCINSVATPFFSKSVKPNNDHAFSNRILKMQIGLILSVLMQSVVILMHIVYSSKITLV